jgi:hypothetical protein
MIAKVRMAPVEQYCNYERDKRALFPEVNYNAATGFEVKIETASMEICKIKGCNGKVWLVLPESLEALYEQTGGLCEPPTWFCEGNYIH